MSALLKFLRFLGYSRCKSGLILLPLCGVLTALLAATDNPSPPPNFIDVAEKAGLTMTNVFGGRYTKKYIIETTGTGVAIFDYDNDGWPDIFIVNGTTLEPLRDVPSTRLAASGQSRDRTGDLRIFSPSLYQLSYLSLAGFPILESAFGPDNGIALRPVPRLCSPGLLPPRIKETLPRFPP